MIKAVGGWLLTTAGLAFKVARADENPRAATAVLGRHRAGPNVLPAATYIFFNPDEAAFVEAAVSRLIPPDEEWGGALEAGVPNYMDKQLAGAWGRASGSIEAVHGNKVRLNKAINCLLPLLSCFTLRSLRSISQLRVALTSQKWLLTIRMLI